MVVVVVGRRGQQEAPASNSVAPVHLYETSACRAHRRGRREPLLSPSLRGPPLPSGRHSGRVGGVAPDRGGVGPAMTVARAARKAATGGVDERGWGAPPRKGGGSDRASGEGAGAANADAAANIASPATEGLVRTDNTDLTSPSSSAAAASVAFSSRRGRRRPAGHGTRRSGIGSRDSGSVDDRDGVDGGDSDAQRRRMRRTGRPAAPPVVCPDSDSDSDLESDCSGASSDDSASVHEVDLPDMAEPASVFCQLATPSETAQTPWGPSWAAMAAARPLSLPPAAVAAAVDAPWPPGGNRQPLYTIPSSVGVLSPASASVAEEPLARRAVGMPPRGGRTSSDLPSQGTAAVDVNAASAAAPAQRVSAGGRQPHAGLSLSAAQPLASPLAALSPRERSRSGWEAVPISPDRAAGMSPAHRSRRLKGGFSRRCESVDVLPPAVASLDVRASSYAEESKTEDEDVQASSRSSASPAAAIHASQLVGAGIRFSIASKMRRSPKPSPSVSISDVSTAAAAAGSGGDDLSVGRSFSTTSVVESNSSGGGGGSSTTESISGAVGGSGQRPAGSQRHSGGMQDGVSERPSLSSGMFRRAPRRTTSGRPGGADAPPSASNVGGSGGSSGTEQPPGAAAASGDAPPALSLATGGGGAPPQIMTTNSATTGDIGGKPFYRRFSNARPGAGSGRVRPNSAVAAGAGRAVAGGSCLSGATQLGGSDRGAAAGAGCVSPTPFSPSEEALSSFHGGGTSTLASASARSRRKIANMLFSRKATSGTPSSSSSIPAGVGGSGPFSNLTKGTSSNIAEEEDICTAFTAALPPSAALSAVTRVLLSAGCDLAVKRDRVVKVKVDAPLGGTQHLHVNVLLEGVAVAGDPAAISSAGGGGDGSAGVADGGAPEASIVSSTLVRLVRSRDDRGRTSRSDFVAFFHDFHAAFVQATVVRP